MKLIKSAFLAFGIFSAAAWFASYAHAQTPPDFPTCSNPEGTLKAKYDNGIHGIPGDPNAYTGTDSVYTLDSERSLQCFCSDAGNGIQTNWWRIDSLNQNEIETLKNLGWNFIPDGSLWGLNPDPYMAKNSTYSCGGSSNNNSGSNNSGGTVLASAASTQGSVLGLAATGDAITIYGLFLIGFASVVLGIYLRRAFRG